jgi:hyperosmotically inducible periplasmic protein
MHRTRNPFQASARWLGCHSVNVGLAARVPHLPHGVVPERCPPGNVLPAVPRYSDHFSQEEIVLRNRSHFRRIASAALLAVAVSACSVVSGEQSGEEYADDATITTKVKTQLASDVGLTPANQISVETSNRVVQLSGFVDSAAHKAQAESVAQGVEDVLRVQNNIIVQP